jgi:hypothetical protein
MPLPIYSSHGFDEDYRAANHLYDEAMALVNSNKAAAIERLERAEGLLASCGEKDGIFIVKAELKKLRGW